MKVKIQQFLNNTVLSWAIVGQNIGRELLRKGWELDLISTDGMTGNCIPDDLKKYYKKGADKSYDLQISYTIPHNFPRYLGNGFKNRIGIWNYDAEIPPAKIIKFHDFCDHFCPSSTFSAENLIRAGVPKDKVKVIPHGLNLKDYNNKDKYPLKTKKKYKILWDIATPHRRKNIRGTLEALGKAFTSKDDVCLVLKASLKLGQNKQAFVDIKKELEKIKKEYDFLEVELISTFIPNIIPLYNACDIVLMLSNFECFGLPALQGLFADKLVIASRHGGQLEFLNDNNSVLVDCDLVRMPRHYQYVEPNPLSRMAAPKIEDAVEKLQNTVKNYDQLFLSKQKGIIDVQNKFTWTAVTDQILELVK